MYLHRCFLCCCYCFPFGVGCLFCLWICLHFTTASWAMSCWSANVAFKYDYARGDSVKRQKTIATTLTAALKAWGKLGATLSWNYLLLLCHNCSCACYVDNFLRLLLPQNQQYNVFRIYWRSVIFQIALTLKMVVLLKSYHIAWLVHKEWKKEHVADTRHSSFHFKCENISKNTSAGNTSNKE